MERHTGECDISDTEKGSDAVQILYSVVLQVNNNAVQLTCDNHVN